MPFKSRAQRRRFAQLLLSGDITPEQALIRFRGDKSKAARLIGWNRPKLYRRMQRFEIPRSFGRP